MTVAALIYAALSGTDANDDLVPALAGGAAFLALSVAVAAVAARALRPDRPSTVGLVLALRDFAVAAALASQAFGTPAASVAGVYGVLMLVAGARVENGDPAHGALGAREACEPARSSIVAIRAAYPRVLVVAQALPQ